MLTRNIIFGGAPIKLITLIGYNPALNIKWNDQVKQI